MGPGPKACERKGKIIERPARKRWERFGNVTSPVGASYHPAVVRSKEIPKIKGATNKKLGTTERKPRRGKIIEPSA